jgi:hypothetical protein
MKRPTRLAALIDVLLFVVEIRVVDTRCTSDEDIDITRDESFGAISRVSIAQLEGSDYKHQNAAQLTHNRHQVRIHPGKGVVVENFARCKPV